jgi:PEP-CTERM motif
MTRRLLNALPGAIVLAFGVTTSAYAGPVVFNFNTLADGANNAAIQAYMDGLLTGGASVTVYNGASATRTYTGDGHVVGPTSSGTTTPLTLGDTEHLSADSTNGVSANATAGATDTFLINNNAANGTGNPNNNGDRIVMGFSNFTIAAGSTISFDYEIFPNGTCPSLSSCGGAGNPNLPGIEFAINGSQIGSTIFGVAPSTSPLYYKNSAAMANETAPQALGTFSYAVANALVNPTLAFVDWPVTIGIDNLTITPPVQQQSGVPEPGSMVLLGTGVVALMRRRRNRK